MQKARYYSNMTVIEELKKRGLIEQIIFEEDLIEKFEKENITFYLGIDPTADSLHVGHLVSINVAKILQKYGHKPLILVGGATGGIGDPSR